MLPAGDYDLSIEQLTLLPLDVDLSDFEHCTEYSVYITITQDVDYSAGINLFCIVFIFQIALG